MTAAGDFVDAALQYEGDPWRGQATEERLGGSLSSYGASVGAVRGTIRDLAKRHPGMGHDDITALSSELWAGSVFERRLAAVVLLQSNVRMLTNTDLTRIEGFIRSAGSVELVDPLCRDVIAPLVAGLNSRNRSRANATLDRWLTDGDPSLKRAGLDTLARLALIE